MTGRLSFAQRATGAVLMDKWVWTANLIRAELSGCDGKSNDQTASAAKAGPATPRQMTTTPNRPRVAHAAPFNAENLSVQKETLARLFGREGKIPRKVMNELCLVAKFEHAREFQLGGGGGKLDRRLITMIQIGDDRR